MTQSIEKSFLIDPLALNNPIYRDSLILSFSKYTGLLGLRYKTEHFFWWLNQPSDPIQQQIWRAPRSATYKDFQVSYSNKFSKIIILYIKLYYFLWRSELYKFKFESLLYKWIPNCKLTSHHHIQPWKRFSL